MIQAMIMKGKQRLIKDNHNYNNITQTGQCHSFCCNCTPIIEVNCNSNYNNDCDCYNLHFSLRAVHIQFTFQFTGSVYTFSAIIYISVYLQRTRL